MSKPLNLHAPVGTIAEKPGVGVLVASGAGAPTASAAGYAKGCLYLDTTNAAVYQNTGTSSSATWTPRGQGAQSAALTAAHATLTQAGTDSGDVAVQALVQNTGFGFVNAAEGEAVIACVLNLMVRVGEIEAALEAAGIVAAN